MRRYKTSIAAVCVLVLAIAGWFAADRLQVENKYNKESERTRLTDLDASEVEEISFENPEESFAL